jgi:hypothetical protein
MWRPKDWPKNPCYNCRNKKEDDYGLLCDWSCGKYSNYANFENGADLMLSKLKEQGEYIKLYSTKFCGLCWNVVIPDDENSKS